MAKARKGEVKVTSKQGLRLRWSYQGKRYEFRPGLPDTGENWEFAKNIARQIELDIKFGNFDPTLSKYRSHANVPQKQNITAVQLFDKYFEFRRSDLAIGTQKKYQALRGQLLNQLKNKPALHINSMNIILCPYFLSRLLKIMIHTRNCFMLQVINY